MTVELQAVQLSDPRAVRGPALAETVPPADNRPPTPPTAGAEPGRDAADVVFESERQERLDAETLETVLDSLLTRYPDAPVTVLKADGVMTPVPESIRLVRNRVLEAHGVLLVLYAPTDEVDASTAQVQRAPKPPPRFSTIETLRRDGRDFEAQMASVVESDQAPLRSVMDEVLGGGNNADVEVELRHSASGEGRPQLAAPLAGSSALTSPVELVRAAADDRSLRSSSERARPLRSA